MIHMEPKIERTIPDKNGRTGKLSNGIKINVINGSSKDNAPTLEAFNPDRSTII